MRRIVKIIIEKNSYYRLKTSKNDEIYIINEIILRYKANKKNK